MNFVSLADFLAMGGHGLYVWSAYGLTLVTCTFLLIHPLLRKRRLLDAQRDKHNTDTQSIHSGET